MEYLKILWKNVSVTIKPTIRGDYLFHNVLLTS